MANIKYEIVKDLGVLSKGSKGWQKEINLVSWNGREAKIEIRDWGPEHEKVGKGITLSIEEMKKLKEILQGMDLDNMDIE